MRAARTDAAESRPFGEYLAPDESVLAAGPGELLEASGGTPVSIGLTDRRLLSVSGDGGFLDVGYEDIVSVRSRPQEPLAFRGVDHRIAAAAGVLLTVLALMGGLAMAPAWGTAALAVSVVAAGVAAASLRRGEADREWPRLNGTLESFYEGTDEPHRLREHRERVTEIVRALSESAEARRWLATAVGAVGVLAFLALLAGPGRALAVLALIALGGLALVDYAVRHHGEFDGIDVVRRHEREVSVHLADGRTVDIRVAAEETVDRELSRLAAGPRAEAVTSS